MSKHWSILAFGSGCSYSGVSCLHFPHRSVWVNRFASMWAAFPLGCWFSRRSVSCRHFHSFWFLLWAAWVFTQPTFFLCLIFFYSFLARRAFAVAAAISRISCEAKVVVCPGGGLLLGHYRLHLNCGGGGRLWVRLFFLKEAEDEGFERKFFDRSWRWSSERTLKRSSSWMLWADIEVVLYLQTSWMLRSGRPRSWSSWKERSRALWAERDRRIPALRDRWKRKIDQYEGSEPRERGSAALPAGYMRLFAGFSASCGCLQVFRLLWKFFIGFQLQDCWASASRTGVECS